MNDLPLHLLDEILFRLEPKSVAKMQCTNKFMKTHISDDLNFEIGYSCRVGSYLFNFCRYGANYVYCHPFVSSCVNVSPGKEANIIDTRCYILGSCCGLLLIYINGLFIVNPLTKWYRILDHSGSKLLPEIVGGDGTIYWNNPEGNIAHTKKAMCVGFAVDQNQTTKRFKVVCILEMQTMYAFEISDGNSWRLSKTTITTSSKSDLTMRMKPVYLDGTLHWLRNDGSIIAFNPETEQANFIHSKFHQKPEMKLFFASDDKINLLTLISGTKELISIYKLLGNAKWALAKQIKNVFMKEKELECWNVVAYDGKRLVVTEKKVNIKGVIHVYDMEANSWGVLGSTHTWANINRDFYKVTPSFLSSLEESEKNKVTLAFNDPRFSSLNKFMGLIDITK